MLRHFPMNALRSTAFAVFLVAAACSSQDDTPCPLAADTRVARGWKLYRNDRIDDATEVFEEALRRCPAHLGATVGAGYGYLRGNRLVEARRQFERALQHAPQTVDALQGIGLVASRRGNGREARRLFTQVLALAPDHAEAREQLDRLGTPPVRAPLEVPNTLVLASRTCGDRFEVAARGRWRPFYIKGVNLGAALPGRFPSQFPDSLTYAGWIAEIAEMGANTIRVYTIHPPHFYEALAEHNRTHTDRPLWLVHGVWAELPPDHDFDDPAWNEQFSDEMQYVVDLIHGRADIAPRPGHTSGFYTADVSRWTLAYILGREWEPFAVDTFNLNHPNRSSWHGAYLAIEGGTAMDVWLTQISERIIAYESETYRHQRPVAYTSWPTLDPLTHPTETTVAEELAIRKSLGGDTTYVPQEYDNDLVAIDPNLMRATEAFRAGVFASYHAYPYYPDFIVVGGGYARYLRRLKQHHRDMPVVIAEYGVPASLGLAHLSDTGWHHGGHTEAEKARIDAESTALIHEVGMAGGMLFAWIDEWFKKNWVVIDLELPRDRARFWLSRLNAEQQYGVIAIEPVPRLDGSTLADRLPRWQTVPGLYGEALRALADETYLHLCFDPGGRGLPDTLLVGLDVVDRKAGTTRWPGKADVRLPIGVEFAIVATPNEVRVLADPNANPFQIERVPVLKEPVTVPPVTSPPPGMFVGPYLQHYNLPLRTKRRDDTRYDSLRVIINRRRFARDRTEYAAVGYDRSVLPAGAAPDGFWEVDSASGIMEIRIPWTLINVVDPSSLQVLSSTADTADGFVPRQIESIGMVAAARFADGSWQQWPVGRAPVAQFRWEPWDEPRWRARRRPVFDAMQRVFSRLDERVAGR
jgi:hypothetical protein